MNTYCTLYVNDKLNLYQLIQIVANSIGGQPEVFDSLKFPNYVIDFLLNQDFDIDKQESDYDGFLHFRFRLECSFDTDTQIAFCVEQISKILIVLWNSEFKAVAACDYEHLLPCT
jgi:hypothetical protein